MSSGFYERKAGESGVGASCDPNEIERPILICLLGSFRLLKAGVAVSVQTGTKTEALLHALALRPSFAIPRDVILDLLWPQSRAALASQSLNTLIYSLHQLLGDALAGARPVLHSGAVYRLNVEAGVGVDVTLFDSLVSVGDGHVRAAETPEAVRYYTRAVEVYRGDLCGGTDVDSLIERERLRSVYLTRLARLANLLYSQGVYAAALKQALFLLARDPCREDAHRTAMRCYVKLGERAQALRQFRICQEILRAEFDAVPESATKALFEQVQRNPDAI